MSRQLPFLAAVLADVAGLALFLLLAAPLAARFADFSFTNTLILALFYALFCTAVYGLKKLPQVREVRVPEWLGGLLENRPVLVGLAVVMALFVALVAGYVSGFFDSIVDLNRLILDEPASTIYLLLTPASYLGLTLIYVLVLSTPAEPAVVERPGRQDTLAFFSLLGVNLMAIVATAAFQALFERFPPAGDAIWPGLLLYLLYLLLFLPPRLIYAAKTGRPVTLFPFLLLVAFLTAGSGV